MYSCARLDDLYAMREISHAIVDSNSERCRRTMINLQSGGFGGFRPEVLPEFSGIVGEHGRLVAGAGDGDVAEAGVEQIWVDAGVGVHQNALGGEAL